MPELLPQLIILIVFLAALVIFRLRKRVVSFFHASNLAVGLGSLLVFTLFWQWKLLVSMADWYAPAWLIGSLIILFWGMLSRNARIAPP